MSQESMSDRWTPGRFHGGFRNALLWGLLFALVGLVIAAISALGVGRADGDARIASPIAVMLSLTVRFGILGVICGTAFWWVTGLLYQRDRFARFGRLPVLLCGAIGTAVFVPLFLQTMNLLSGDGLVAWRLVLDDAVWAFFFGATASLGSLELARRWTRDSA